MTEYKRLILVDGSSYLFRAFHALPPLVNSKQIPTGAVKGVINMIRSMIKSNPDSNVVIVFDAKGKTFRNDLYDDYKAHRPPMPDELKVQIAPIHRIVQAMGLPVLIIDGVEADDVIGTLAREASEAGISTLISTGDKDLAQLVDDQVSLINTMTNEALDVDGVKSKFGVYPNQIIDYLALVGDSADNIPGVPSVGPKTAVKWLSEHQSMLNIIDNAPLITGKVGERLRESIDVLLLSYELATIKIDVDLKTGVKDLKKKDADNTELLKLFSELEFKTWVNELKNEGAEFDPNDESIVEKKAVTRIFSEIKNIDLNYSLVDSEKGLKDLIVSCESLNCIGLSFEVDTEHFMDAKVVGIGLSFEPGHGVYIPLSHVEIEQKSDSKQLDAFFVFNQLKPVLENDLVLKAGHDLKNMAHVFENHGVNLTPLKADIMVASYVYDSVSSKHRLFDIARDRLGLEMTDFESLLGKGRNKKTVSQVAPVDVMKVSAEKADFSLRSWLILNHLLSESGILYDVFRYFEQPLIQVLKDIEKSGVSVDQSALRMQSSDLEAQLKSLATEVFNLAGENFNLGSPKQLQSILYDKLGLPMLKKTKTGQPSTAEPVLAELAESFELPRLILEYRSLSKIKSTYTDKLPLQIQNRTRRIHSTFQQAVTATGRLSSTDPNLQNIPIRTHEGRRVRKAFISVPDYKLLAADYSQVELRIMAHLSQDPGLLAAFNSDQDVHRATASDVFSVAINDVSDEERRSAKAINFGLIYGMSAFGLAKQLNIGRQEASEYIERYFAKYPNVKNYMDQTQSFAGEKGFVETIFGRRLYLPDINAGNGMLRKAAQRTAINAPMQGSAADIIKRAMIDIYNWLPESGLDARMLLQVHDELVFEVHHKDVELVTEGVNFRMMSAASLSVPLVVDIGVGDNWDEAH
ncbi:DNA polymerase I [Gammaproteobacteria bacterium]|nr:DNA polymerase I [Gammaproteobacteria bacterium]MDB2444454.1 DNA polymerase I [Gammaproteobacteria bacterium]